MMRRTAAGVDVPIKSEPMRGAGSYLPPRVRPGAFFTVADGAGSDATYFVVRYDDDGYPILELQK